MGKAVRAVITKDDQLLVMHRNKYGSQYFTLVGGLVHDNETTEQALAREVKEETGLEVTSSRLVFTEDHPEPYNSQYIYLCEVRPSNAVKISEDSEEGWMNRLDMNIHTPVWVNIRTLSTIQFRTPQLHQALIKGLRDGFPPTSVKL